MSLQASKLDKVLQIMSQDKALYRDFRDALYERLTELYAESNGAARKAVFDHTLIPAACAAEGKCIGLDELLDQIDKYVR